MSVGGDTDIGSQPVKGGAPTEQIKPDTLLRKDISAQNFSPTSCGVCSQLLGHRERSFVPGQLGVVLRSSAG